MKASARIHREALGQQAIVRVVAGRGKKKTRMLTLGVHRTPRLVVCPRPPRPNSGGPSGSSCRGPEPLPALTVAGYCHSRAAPFYRDNVQFSRAVLLIHPKVKSTPGATVRRPSLHDSLRSGMLQQRQREERV